MQRILILKADLICAEALRDSAQRTFPHAAVVLVSRIERAEAVLNVMQFDLLVTGLDLPDGDALDFIFACAKSLRRARRVLVVTQHHEQRTLETLHAWRVEGVFDPSSEGEWHFAHALRAVADGKIYWSGRLRAHLDADAAGGNVLARRLTTAELAVLARLGDGSDDNAAAKDLGRESATIQGVRRRLHRKLGLHHKGELVQHAARLGFVRFKREGVVRPGFEQLRAAYDAHRRPKRPAASKPDGSVAAA